MAEKVICLFKGGILSGLQFEIDDPPHRIRADYLTETPISLKVGPVEWEEIATSSVVPYKRGEDVYKATRVHIRATTLEEELGSEIVVYLVDRSW